ncbi:V-type H+-transporting ATPase 16kDa proteolipid subunit [Fusarium verticillioides 7600]|uniref:V-type proton ATPase proteolipid subunit n=2 Tax=Gibberella moniliformis (strain M3125 / FGSC 7600) TaxID=334819 RepID=W7MPX0_GIBM7|nr:V-type H+-transporting ATPase 16kDa proteolipid subunit [Fusarium verticillioides 7600]EWG46662.1 V-type H+-transporting ATPase 16kDa proteolipid subunit [Fusarium verticillioides 7600]
MDAELLANMDRCPMYASFFGALGCACSIVFTTFGAAYGTAKSAGAIFQSGILRPDMMMQNTYDEMNSTLVKQWLTHFSLCAIMAQILSIYGLVASVIMSNNIKEKMAIHTAFLQLGAGISVGLCGMAAGFAIGIVGDAGVRASSQQPRLYIGMVLILIFAEVLGLYGVIVSILMLTRSTDGVTECRY